MGKTCILKQLQIIEIYLSLRPIFQSDGIDIAQMGRGLSRRVGIMTPKLLGELKLANVVLCREPRTLDTLPLNTGSVSPISI